MVTGIIFLNTCKGFNIFYIMSTFIISVSSIKDHIFIKFNGLHRLCSFFIDNGFRATSSIGYQKCQACQGAYARAD